ncbi:hypothetical protein PVAP13_2NG006775 [Panicum virgatum]|uniref:Uncharacterized protein n=1 Tax=Panicum virgatum TaxID=38727 RepID=A0A8T0VA55_PANVG|nr:hypothetical protein PVAP13_2NG006775 [Panicum virgatum]
MERGLQRSSHQACWIKKGLTSGIRLLRLSRIGRLYRCRRLWWRER